MSDFDFIPAGIAICDPTGVITQLNATMLSWLDSSDKREFIGRPFHSILAPAAKIYFETHIRPMLMVEKSVQEISIEIMAPASQRIGVYLNGQVESSETGEPIALHFALFNGQQRYLYELELRERR
ncbi:MAG: hypothetical protein EX271_11725, partial [Acidimicrobiales bacterium]